jgi:AraC family transcriptional regulator
MPTFVCLETSPDAVREANEKGTAIVEVAMPVPGPVKGSVEMRVCELPGGRMVRTLHRGPYETCESTYLALFSWREERHLQVAGPIREIYPNNPREVRSEAIVTEIMVPVRLRYSLLDGCLSVLSSIP